VWVAPAHTCRSRPDVWGAAPGCGVARLSPPSNNDRHRAMNGIRLAGLAAFLSLVAGACATEAPARPNARIPLAAPGETRSLFGAAWTWRDEQGEAVRFDRWRGAPIFVSMVFTSCTSACPRTIERLRRVSDTFKSEGRAATFVLVTLDPANDTPDQLRRFKLSRGLPPEWHLLRGDDGETRALADLLQVKVVENAHIFHDSRIVVFDRDGKLAGQLHG
jgi:protein SCO1/2